MADDEKKKKNPGLVQNVKDIYGMGKKLYGHYMKKRKQMSEVKPPTGPTMRQIVPPKPPEKEPGGDMKKPISQQPPKKKKEKKPRGGVGGVLDKIQERKDRMREALED